MTLGRHIVRAVTAVAIACAALASRPQPARAFVEGTTPAPFDSYLVFGDGVAIGNTLMANPPPALVVNTVLLEESSRSLSGIPNDAEVQAVYLWWSGSLAYGEGVGAVDNDALLTVPSGASQNIVADDCRTLTTFDEAPFPTPYIFYYCRADITAFVADNPGMFGYNGNYTVGDVYADPGHVSGGGDDCTGSDPRCQAKYAAWSMAFVYDSQSVTMQRDVIIYDGFAQADETNTSLGIINFNISGFLVGTPPQAEIQWFGLEGDRQLGGGPFGHCTNCWDFFQVNGTKIDDGNGAEGVNNVFDSTVALSVDLDNVSIGSGGYGLVDTGDTSMAISTGTGDTILNPTGGTGETIFLGWVFLRLNRPSPNFRGSATTKFADPTAATGETVFYNVTVTNQGSLDATGTVFSDALPTGMTYQAGSVRVDGAACTDAADADACTVSGGTITVNLGNIPYTGDNNRAITFRGTMAATGVGTTVCNVGQVTSTQTPTPAEVGPACTTVESATLGQPTKVDVDLTGGATAPGDPIQYTITIPGDPGSATSGVAFQDDVPAHMTLLSWTSPGGTAVDESTFTGGANGNGRVRFTNISIPAAGSVSITITALVDSEANWVADGVPASDIHGQVVCNQGTVTAGFVPGPLPTNDTATAAPQDPTCYTVTYAPLFGTSNKLAVDDDGGVLDPGDTITYTINLVNSGNRTGTIDLVDNFPAWVGGVVPLPPPVSGATYEPPPAGTNGTGRLVISGMPVAPGSTTTIRFRATVAAAAPDGTVITNAAAITVAERPEENRTLTSPSLTVYARPELGGLTKTVTDLNGGAVEPGDTVRYDLAVTNTGNVPATSVVLTDLVDARLTNVVVTSGGGTWNAATRTITWTRASLAVGESWSVAFTAQLVTPLANGTTIPNQASIDSAEPAPAALSDNPATGAVDDPTTITVVSAPNLSNATKVVADLDGAPYEPGDTVEYTIAVSNTGSETATSVVITDPVDPNLEDVVPQDGGTVAGGTITWNVGAIAPGETRTVRFTATIRSPLLSGTAIANQGALSTPELPGGVVTDDPATPAGDDPTVFTVTSAASFTTSTVTFIDLNGGAQQPGDAIEYTVTAPNTGTSPATGIVVTMVIDAAFATVVPQDGGVWNPVTRTVTWTLAGPLDPGDAPLELQVVATLAAALPNGTPVCEDATIDSAQSAPFTTAEACFTVESRPDFAASEKTVIDVNGGTVNPGDVLSWQIAVLNEGTQAGTNVVVTDVVDANLTAVTPLDGGSWNAATRTITWTIASIPAGGSVIVRFDATVASPLDDGTTVANQATIACTGCPAPEPTDDPATAALDDPTSVVVGAQPAFTVTKTFADDDGGILDPGDAVTYTIVVQNDGTSCADQVVVSDATDPDLQNLVPENGGTVTGATVTWNAATTPALARVCTGAANAVTLRVHANVDAPIADGTQICNQAQTVSEELATPTGSDDPSTPAPLDPTCRVVISGANFTNATKTVVDTNGAPARPGDALTWTISLTNEGNATAMNVTVRDPIDPSLTNVVPGSGGVVAAGEIRWDGATTPALAQVDVGETVTLTFTATIATPLDNGTVIANQAEISAELGVTIPQLTDDPATAALDDPTSLTVTSAALVTATKTVADENGGVAAPGDVFLYTITLTNSGDAVADGISVTDTIPTTLNFVQVLDGGTWNAASRTFQWSVPLLAPGTPVTVRFRASAAEPLANGTAIVNQGTYTVEGDPAFYVTDDPTTPAPSDPTVIVIVAAPDLTASLKTVSGAGPGGIVVPGAILTYEIRVINSGDAVASAVTVVDPVDTAHLDTVTPLDGGVWNAATSQITWNLAQVQPGVDAIVRFTARVRFDVQDAVVINNQATVAATEVPAPVPTDDPLDAPIDDPTEVVTDATPQLDVDKTVADENGLPVAPGDLLTYEVRVAVVGPAHAYNVVVTDTISGFLTDVTPGTGGTFAAGQITWNVAHIAPGTPAVLTFTARVRTDATNGQLIPNQAQVTAGGLTMAVVSDDPTTVAMLDPTVVEVVAAPILEIEKTYIDDNGGAVAPGDTVTWVLTVRNDGTAPSDATRVFDPLPAQMQYVPGSTLVNGVPRPDAPGGLSPLHTPPGVDLGTVAVGTAGAQTITWKAQVVTDALAGTILTNQAFGQNDFGENEPSDDPATAAEDDPTQVVVGGGALLASTTKTYDPTPIGDDGDGLFDAGEIIQYRVTIQNSGDSVARDVVLTDPMPVAGAYVAGSLRLGGALLTDPADGDAGEVVGGILTVRAGDLAPDASVEILFRVRVLGGTTEVVNQGTVDSDDTPPEPTDADGNDANGDQATVTPVGSRAAVSITKGVDDLSGGVVLAGDELLYSVQVRNDGTRPLTDVSVEDTLPDFTFYIEGSSSWPATVLADRLLTMSGLELEPGETITITFRVRIATGDAAPEDGQEICNVARVLAGESGDESDPACVVVGAVAGTGRLEGRAYVEGKVRDRVYQAEDDQALAGLQLLVYPEDDSRGAPIAGLVTSSDDDDTKGTYRLNAVPPGEYVIRAFSSTGTQLGMVGHITVADGRLTEQDVWIDPSGRVYDAATGRYVQGVRAFLYYDEEDDQQPGALVPDERLGPGQQGQVTGAEGFYKFDVLPNRGYRLVIDAGTSSWSFPSQMIPPTPGFAEPGPVVDDSSPSLEPNSPRTYYLRFALAAGDEDVTNNHVPLDPLTTQVRLDKRADRPEASLAEIVTYTITVQNRSARDFTAAAGQPVFIEDFPELGLSYLKGHAAAQVAKGNDVSRMSVGNGVGQFQERVAAPGSHTQLTFGPFDLPAGATLTLAYQVVVGLDTRQGVYENRALLRDGGGTVLSNEDGVELRVVNDPIFDEALLIGRVFCDDDGDGRLDPRERGVLGARVYIDSGSYSVTDVTGKWHLGQIDPGMHMIKLDPATLPPGSALGAGDEGSEVIYLTRGLATRRNFAVKCGTAQSVATTDPGVGTIKLSGKTKLPPAPPKPTFEKVSTTITGDLVAMAAAVDGKPIALPTADVELVLDPALALPVTEGAPNIAPPANGKGWQKPQPIFRASFAAASPAASWTLTIKHVSAAGEVTPARTITGTGAPGEIAWDGLGDDGQPVARDAVYVVQLRVVADDRSEASSARKSFGVAYGLPAAEEQVETLRGNFFGGSAKKPKAKAALKQQVKGLAGRIGAQDTVVIEVHADGTGNRLKKIAETQKQADLVKELLAAEGIAPARIKARGRGSLDPVTGTKTKKQKAENKRVVVRITPPPPATAGAPVPPPAPGAADALVQGEAATIDEAGRFVRNLPTPADGRILIDLMAADGRRAMTIVVVEPPRGAKPAAPRGGAGGRNVRITGDLSTGGIAIDGVALDTSLLAVDVGIAGAAPGSEPNFGVVTPKKKKARRKRGAPPPAPPKARLDRSVGFELAVPSSIDVGRWELTVRRDAGTGQEGEVVLRLAGEGLPPSTSSWDGEDPGGDMVLRNGDRYLYRLVVEDRAGNLAESPTRAFTVGVGKRGGFQPVNLKGSLFTKRGDVSAKLKNALARLKTAIGKRPAGERYQLEVVYAPAASASPTEAKMAMMQRVGKLKAYLVKLKVPMDRVDVQARLIEDGTPKKNRKDTLRITAVPPAPSAPARVVVGGAQVALDGEQFTTEATVAEGGALVIDVTTATGHRASFVVPETALDGTGRAPASQPSGDPASQPSEGAAAPDGGVESPAGAQETDLIAPDWGARPPEPVAAASDGDGLMAPGAAAVRDEDDLRLDRAPAVTLSFADDDSEFGGAELEDALADPESVAAREAQRNAQRGSSGGRLIAQAGSGVMIEVPPEVLAADLVVNLPPRGLKVRSTDLWVSGKTNAKNKVRINGREVRVRRDGTFDELVELPPGASTLTVEAIDPDENVATISWPVQVTETEHFLMVLADGAISSAYGNDGWSTTGAELNGMTGDSTVTAGHALLHGRVAVYYKGRIKGGDLFKGYKITGHLDTAKQAAFEEFFQETLDPSRDYAVYGDASEEVRDANARGKLYLLVEADDSKALVGNFKSALQGGDLFRYDRTVYGAAVDFKRSFGSVKQEVRAFGSLGDGRLARDVNVFRATGGSLYYLRHGRLVEGGERIRIVVRDRDNGLVLSERALMRDVDYVLDTTGGRIMFKEPIASTADGAFLIDNLDASQTPLDGHPVYVEVTYEYELDEGTGGAAGGVYVRDTFFDTLAVGAGVIGEGRDDAGGLDDYNLMGADLTWKPKKRTVLRAEVARSESSDAGNFISQDGGLSFQGLDAVGTTVVDAGRGGHAAWKIEVESQLGDFARAEWAESTRVRLYAQDLDRGFSSGGTILEQGRTKFGAQAIHKLNATDTLTVRTDGEIAELPRVGPSPEAVAAQPDPLDLYERGSYLSTIQWARVGERYGLKVETAWQAVLTTLALEDGSVETIDVHRLGIGALASWKLTKKLVLRLGQEFQFTTGDELSPQLPAASGAEDKYDRDPFAGVATTVGADWTLAPELKLSATGALRWNGDTAMQVGLKTPIGDSASMYLNQRFEDRSGRLVSTTIVGGEERFGAARGGKAYGEYQLESGMLGVRNRAVLGVGHRWTVMKGWNIAAGYEHQQTFGGYLPDGTPTGENLRDVLHLGTEYVKRDRFKLSATLEFRFDDGLHGQPGSIEPKYQDLVEEDRRGVTPPGTYPDHGGTPGAPLVIPPGERLQIVATAAADWKWNEDQTFLARFRLAHTENLTNHGRDLPDGVDTTFAEARFIEATAGWAYRPLRLDWLDVLVKYSYLLDMRPIGLNGQAIENQSHVFSVAPIVELPYRFQLSAKLAWKRTATDAEIIEDQVLSATVDAFLWLTRLSYKFYGGWDVATEYRYLRLTKPEGGESRHGWLVEVDYNVSRNIRLGLGYNFSRFSDDELADLERDTHGLFFRVVGRY